jgi:hypothetical protein
MEVTSRAMGVPVLSKRRGAAQINPDQTRFGATSTARESRLGGMMLAVLHAPVGR